MKSLDGDNTFITLHQIKKYSRLSKEIDFLLKEEIQIHIGIGYQLVMGFIVLQWSDF